MAEELVQRIVVQVQGAGNLPQHLADARTQADALTKSVGQTRQAIDRTNPDLDSAFDGTQGQRTAGTPGPTVASSGGTWGQHGAAVAAANAALANNMTLAERMAKAWETASKEAKAAAEAAERVAVIERKRVEHYQRQDDAFEASKKPSMETAGVYDSDMAKARLRMSNAAEFEANKREAEAKRTAARQRIVGTAGVAFGSGMGSMVGLGGLANPWAVERFQRASADLGAVIGRDLLPYLEQATTVVRAMADAYLNLPSPLKSVVAGTIAVGTAAGGTVLVLAGVGKMLSLVASTATAAASAIGVHTAAMHGQSAAALAGGAASGAGVAAGAAGGAASGALAGGTLAMIAKATVVGLAAYGAYEGGKYLAQRNDGKASSVGAAARPSAYMDAASFLRETQLDVLKSGAKPGDIDPSKLSMQQLKLLEQILEALKEDDGRDPAKVANAFGGIRPVSIWHRFNL